MTLIAILLAMATEKYWHSLFSKKLFSPVQGWHDFLLKYCGRMHWFNGPAGVLLVVTPAVLIVALLQMGISVLDGFFVQMLGLLMSFGVLVACIGDQRLGPHVRRYIKAVKSGDLTTASAEMKNISAHPDDSGTLRNVNYNFFEFLLLRFNERVLALMFWFVVLGPLGAVLYRIVIQLQTEVDGKRLITDENKREEQAGKQVLISTNSAAVDTPLSEVTAKQFNFSARRLKGILDWLPVRLTAFCYAMMGSFIDAMRYWRVTSSSNNEDWVDDNHRLLLNAGLGALQIQDYYDNKKEDDIDSQLACAHVLAVRALCKRTLFAWVSLLSLLTLTGWLS